MCASFSQLGAVMNWYAKFWHTFSLFSTTLEIGRCQVFSRVWTENWLLMWPDEILTTIFPRALLITLLRTCGVTRDSSRWGAHQASVSGSAVVSCPLMPLVILLGTRHKCQCSFCHETNNHLAPFAIDFFCEPHFGFLSYWRWWGGWCVLSCVVWCVIRGGARSGVTQLTVTYWLSLAFLPPHCHTVILSDTLSLPSTTIQPLLCGGYNLYICFMLELSQVFPPVSSNIWGRVVVSGG